MTDTQIFEPDGRAIPYAVEGEGPVALVLLSERDLGADGLGVISHYLVEEAGFHVVRVDIRADSDSLDERVQDAVAVIDHLGLEHTWIGGHGAGGTVAGRSPLRTTTVSTACCCSEWRIRTSRSPRSSPC